jgi:hypothetical protein
MTPCPPPRVDPSSSSNSSPKPCAISKVHISSPMKMRPQLFLAFQLVVKTTEIENEKGVAAKHSKRKKDKTWQLEAARQVMVRNEGG